MYSDINIFMESISPTKILDQVLSKEQLETLRNQIIDVGTVKTNIHPYDGLAKDKIISRMHMWDFYKEPRISDIIKSSLPEDVSDQMIVQTSYLLKSYIPYDIHSDCGWLKLDDNEEPYYLILIPITDTPSKTIVLNQLFTGNHFVEYKKLNNPLPLSQQMTKEEYAKYFGHCWPQEKPYISIETIFEWKAGDVLITDIKRLHCSDNFLETNITEKQCIVLFTKRRKLS